MISEHLQHHQPRRPHDLWAFSRGTGPPPLRLPRFLMSPAQIRRLLQLMEMTLDIPNSPAGPATRPTSAPSPSHPPSTGVWARCAAGADRLAE
jgi:hypothetical protein